MSLGPSQGDRIEKHVAAIETAITDLDNDDLLDLADIFEAKSDNPIKEIANAEMQRRRISLLRPQ